MNVYGPSFSRIHANRKLGLIPELLPNFIISFDVFLYDTLYEQKANIIGFSQSGSNYPEFGSQVPAVFIDKLTQHLSLCMASGLGTECQISDTFDLATVYHEWFNLKIEHRCWGENCYLFGIVNGDVVKVFATSSGTFNDVEIIFGNTYDQEDIIPARGGYENFKWSAGLDSDDLQFTVSDEPAIEA